MYPLVWGTDGRPRAATGSDTLEGAFSEVDTVAVLNNSGGTLPILSPVYKTGTTNEVDLAQATTGARKVIGLLTAAITDGNSGFAQTDGRLAGTGAQWQAVGIGAGSGATPGQEIFLSADTEGLFIIDPDADIAAGEKIVFIGTFISALILEITIQYLGTK